MVARPRLAKEEKTGFRCAKHPRHNDAGRRRYVGVAIEEVEERGEKLSLFLFSLPRKADLNQSLSDAN